MGDERVRGARIAPPAGEPRLVVVVGDAALAGSIRFGDERVGKTRSAQRAVNVGFAALQAALSADEWQTDKQPVVLQVRTTTLDGEPQPAEGTVKIYRLKQPAQVQRAPLGGSYANRHGVDQTTSRPDWSNPNQWDLADTAAEKSFRTDAEGTAKLEWTLGPGAYRAMLETQDRFSKKVIARLPLQVLAPDDTRLAIRIPHLLAAPHWSVWRRR